MCIYFNFNRAYLCGVTTCGATMGNSIVKIKPQRFRSETHKATNVSRQKLAGPSVATRGTTPGVHNVAPDCTRHDNILTVTSVDSPLSLLVAGRKERW